MADAPAVAARSRKLFYGWVVVAAAFSGQVVNHGVAAQGFGTFLVPLEQHFGWSKTALSGARSLMQIENGLVGPVEGAIIDRFGSRLVMALGFLLLGLGLIFLGLIQSLWHYYLVFALIAIGSSLCGFVVTATAINHWFRRQRTFALGVAQTGIGFAGVAVIPLLVFAQDAFGWRAAAIAAGLCVWVAAVPICLLLRDKPEPYGLLPDGDSVASQTAATGHQGDAPASFENTYNFTLGQALRTRTFWQFGVAHGISVMAIAAIITHQFAHMEMDEGVGLARSSAALVVTVMSAVQIGGRLLGGYLGDRMNKQRLAALGNVLTAVSLVILATAHSLTQAMAFAVLFGFAWGMRGPMMSSMRGDFFGRTHFAKITGTASLLTMPFSMVGPILAGFLADTQGNYQFALLLLAALSAIGCPLFLTLRRPATPTPA